MTEQTSGVQSSAALSVRCVSVTIRVLIIAGVKPLLPKTDQRISRQPHAIVSM